MKGWMLVLLGVFWCTLEGKLSWEIVIVGAFICAFIYIVEKLNSTWK